jgi:hypothetical protein
MRGLAEASETVPETKPSRKVRQHYGTKVWDKFEAPKHEFSRRCVSNCLGQFLCSRIVVQRRRRLEWWQEHPNHEVVHQKGFIKSISPLF